MPRLKKKAFLATASGALALNFAAFCFGAMGAFYRGNDSVENQAALILIPALLIPAAAVVSALLLVFYPDCRHENLCRRARFGAVGF